MSFALPLLLHIINITIVVALRTFVFPLSFPWDGFWPPVLLWVRQKSRYIRRVAASCELKINGDGATVTL